jgi:hypothetical protein
LIALPFGRQSLLLDGNFEPVEANGVTALWNASAPVGAGAEPPKAEMDSEHVSADAPLAVVADALKHIDASDYNLWVKIGHGLKQSFGSDGLPVWKT